MWMNRKQSLKKSYYQSFLALIVVPILLMIVLSIAFIRTMMVDFAVRNIKAAQENVGSTLGKEVRDVSMRLSHFVYVNNSEIMSDAARTNTKDVAEKYHYTGVLTQAFNYAMVPVQDVLSSVFFMKDGDSTYMKDDLILTDEEVKGSDWYHAALAQKNVVKIGFYDTNVTYSRRNFYSLTMVAALSPGLDVDRDGVIEMTTLFTSSQAGNLIKHYNKDKLLGSTMILKQDGTMVFDAQGTKALLPENWMPQVGKTRAKVDGRNYVYVASVEPVTGLRIVSVVEPAVLTREFNRVAFSILAGMILIFALFYLFSSYFLKNIIRPIHDTVEGMKKVEEGNLEVHIQSAGQAELRTMTDSFNHMTKQLKQLIEENKEQERMKHDAEIKALQSQINPHFLVNSLNSIRFIAQVSKFDAIAKMAEALIRILSCSFRGSVGFYQLKEELEVLDGFIYLMKIRYSDGFDISYEIEGSCRQCLVPRLLLQPIVENSIVHGFSDLGDEMGQIRVSIGEESGRLHIVVEDNGKGMAEEEIAAIFRGGEKEDKDHVSIGISNVYTRLKLNYGGECSLSIESEPGRFTRTVICLPAQREEKKA